VDQKERHGAKRQVTASNEDQIELRRRLRTAPTNQEDANPKRDERNKTNLENIATVYYAGGQNQNETLLNQRRFYGLLIRRRR
jgi:hypothetical protein